MQGFKIMVKLYTNRELSEKLGINLAKWKRWSREFLPPDPLGGMQSGFARQYYFSDVFTVRLGGHLVQGHVDNIGSISKINVSQLGRLVTIQIPKSLTKYVIPKGSIALNGVSLTIADIVENQMTVSIIPHTWEKTTFQHAHVGDKVNVEVDLIGKYVEKFLKTHAGSETKISESWLKSHGF